MKSKNYHWKMVALLCGLAASAIGVCINCVGIFYTSVSDSIGVMRGSFAIHATISQLAISAVALFIPKLITRVPYKRMLLAGALAASLSTCAMATSRSLWLFYILGLIRGAGVGMFSTVPITIILTNWFHQKHGVATSITLSFSGLAGAVFSPLLAACITRFGWERAYLVMGSLILLLTLPALLAPFTVRPQDMGLHPYGEVRAEKSGTSANGQFSYRNLTFICLCIMTLLHTSIAGIAQHFTGFAASIGFSSEIGALMMSCSMIGNILTKLVIGFLSDRIGAVRASVSMIGTNIAALLLLLIGSSLGNGFILCAAAFLYGSVYSVANVGFSLLSKHFFGAGSYPKAYSVIGLLTTTGAALALPLIGYLYDFTGSYIPMFWVALAIHVIDLTLLAIIVKQRGRAQ